MMGLQYFSWVAYQSNESGRPEIYVRPLAPPASSEAVSGVASGTAAGAASGAPANATGGQGQVSTAGGTSPSWRADGQALYYLGPRGEMMATPIAVRGTALEPGTPVVLFPTRIVAGGADTVGLGRQYDLTRDGRFLINTLLDDAAATPITLIQHWQPDAKK